MASVTDGEGRNRGVGLLGGGGVHPSSLLRYASPSSRSSAGFIEGVRAPLMPAFIHHYPDAEVSGGILAELGLERLRTVRS
jgi:hypothetical protein